MSIDMKDNKRINVSSLIDNEQGSDEQFTDVLNELSSSETAAESWKNYHLIGDALRNTVNDTISIDVSADIAKAIANEPTVFSPKNSNAPTTTRSPLSVNDDSDSEKKTTKVLAFKAKVSRHVKSIGQMAVAASAAGLMILSVQNSNDNTADFESVIPSSVVQTMPFGGVADPVSFNYSTPSRKSTFSIPTTSNGNKEKTLDQQARIEQKRRFQALLIDHQQQIKLSQYSPTAIEK